jgi:hypothetical protein
MSVVAPSPIRSFALAPLLVVVLALAASGCGGGADAATTPRTQCPKTLQSGWKKLATTVGADVYCPAWLPAPLIGQVYGGPIGGADNAVLSVSKDRSYLASWIWVEAQSGEVHVNLRGYPGQTTMPRCVVTVAGSGQQRHHKVPCFADAHGTVNINGIKATAYTVNQGADQWHLAYAWRHDGSLYTVSQHIAAPLTYDDVNRDLKRILAHLVLVEPAG